VARSGIADRLIVSSDSEEVLRWADLHGFEGRARPAALAEDASTISDVAVHLMEELDWEGDVGVFQPTSPFRSVESLRLALAEFHEHDVDSLASVVQQHHGYWFDENEDLSRARPLFGERVNRQWARHPVYRETGSIQFVRTSALREGGQIVTSNHRLFATPDREALDIDTNEDLVEARRRLEQGTVVFRVRANARVGSGHVHHCLHLADELADQKLIFLLNDCDPFVADLVADHGYEHHEETFLAEDLATLAGPGGNVVVNDVLDTSEEEVLVERSAGFRVVNVEDLGPGARLADWVVNALYPVGDDDGANVSSGPQYATLRSEFINLPPKTVRERPERILITFGGTDPGGLAARCTRLLAGRVDAEVRVILGLAAPDADFPEGVTVERHVKSMAAEMMDADLVLCAAGRTVYEAAAVGTPVAVLAQGAREATHSHLSFMSGVVFLGIGPLVDDQHVVGVVQRLLGDHALRLELSERLRSSVDARGAARIGHRVRGLLRGL
jgi:spore coat polysaccharide biosynthesis predicted glycosyltransferase SpsG/CMP-N-acetylneuraminic acid synthetase